MAGFWCPAHPATECDMPCVGSVCSRLEPSSPRTVVQQHVHQVAEQQTLHLEALARVFLADTGLRADEIELVQRQQGIETVWFYRKRQV
jgi:hypothetical protein